MDVIIKIILVGIGANLLMDIWSYLLSCFKIQTLDYKFVGRWIGGFVNGKFAYQNVIQATPVKYEKTIGWVAHYLIGITFSFLLILCVGADWLDRPTLLPALIVGIVTIIAPFFIMQPAFGFGIAASKLNNPSKARLMSLLSHSIYGIGLYLTAVFIQWFSNLI